MSSRLHRKPGHPYYIYALDYRETSSGICALHYLCHALNLEGFEAYVTGTFVRNEQLKTPLLTEEIVERHLLQQRIPIAIYPEVVTGNPLCTKVVARYMLNREGVINGNRVEAESDDLFFYYSSAFTPTTSDQFDLLTLPMLDTDIFSIQPHQPPGARSLLYLNRIPASAVDFSTFPEDLEVLSMAAPLPLAELAKTLRQAKVLYAFELSSTCTIAMLCGCPVVMLDLPGYEALGFSDKNLAILEGNGYARRDELSEIERARLTLPQVTQIYQRIEDQFWQQLAVFCGKTQLQAQIQLSRSQSTARRWMNERKLNPAQMVVAKDRLGEDASSLIELLIEARGRSGEEIEVTLASLRAAGDVCGFSLTLAVIVDTAISDIDKSCRLIDVTATNAASLINAHLQDANADWFMIVEAGSEFSANGLLIAALELRNVFDSCLAVYADEAMRLSDDDYGLSLRPDFNLDMLLSFPASLSPHWLFRRQAFLHLGGFLHAAGQAVELDYQLRLLEEHGLGCVGHVSEPLLTTEALRLQDRPDERAAIERHLHRRGYTQAYVGSSLPGRYEVDYRHGVEERVSILIVLGECLLQAQRCVETLLEQTLYSNYEVLLLDRGNTAPEVTTWLAGIEAMDVAQLRVLRYAADVSLVDIRNQAAHQAQGTLLLWLDAGVAIVAREWLHQLVNHALRPEIGCVAAKLLAADGHVRHAGLVLGLGGLAGRAFEGAGLRDGGYMQRLQVDQNYTALSGECLMLRRDLFLHVGGFEASPLFTPWADVDLCLRLHQAGYLNVWTPRAQLLMAAPMAVAPSAIQEEAMYGRWLTTMARDPAYNVNLSLTGSGFTFDQHGRRLTQGLLPQILCCPADDSGCGHYRIRQPMAALRQAGLVDGPISGDHPTALELERQQISSVIFQRQITDSQRESLRQLGRHSSALLIYELDDYLPNLPLKSAHRSDMPKDVLKSLRQAIGYCDRLVVSTPVLAEALAGMNADTRVVPNFLPPHWWAERRRSHREGLRPRVGWAGGGSHRGDLELVVDVVRALAAEVDWVFFGMCPDALRSYVREFHLGVSIEHYPETLAGLGLDLAIAPLEDNLFNRCKTNLRLLEYGACGFPVVCSDLEPYQGDLAVTRVRNRFKDWCDAIRVHLADPVASARQGNILRQQVLAHWMLEGANLQHWRAAWLPN